MRVVNISELQEEPLGEATPIEGWSGGAVTRSRQTIIPDGDSENYRCSVVNFSRGATTGWHAHTCDQILVITAGTGIVATEEQEQEVTVGDVVHIKAGERHWHGAKANTTMSHITITTAGGESRR
ncbi:MAG: cupin domain-containing protein [Planctomycetaceae bacterium]|jgi:quercetin dioxygenase-like cupin family protein|nr:MAG: cupin domain-containing protein [Planctomycetaceae bacterium]